MTKIAFTVTAPSGDLESSVTIADADFPRIMGYLMASSYGTVTENVQSSVPDASWSPGEGETEDDRPLIAMQQRVTRPATLDEAAANYARAILNQLLTATVEHEKAELVRLATESVQPINPIV